MENPVWKGLGRRGNGVSGHLLPGEAGSIMKPPAKCDNPRFGVRRKSWIFGPAISGPLAGPGGPMGAHVPLVPDTFR